MADLPLPEPPRSLSDHLAEWRASLPELTRPRVVAGAVVVIAVVIVAALLLRNPPPAPLVLPKAVPEASGATPGTGSPGTGIPGRGGAAGSTTPTSGPPTITVHAAGAVVRPGIYAVGTSARVADVLAAAGGAAPDADLDQVNLAAKVTDAERVYIARRGEAPPPVAAGGQAPPGGQPAGPVDLNTATAEQLDVLPGVGPATAQAIIQFRTTQGRFRSVDDLLEVRGIGPAKLEALRPLVTVR